MAFILRPLLRRVLRATQSQAQGEQSALAELCRLYLYPLYIFARRRGHSPDDAQQSSKTNYPFDTGLDVYTLAQANTKFVLSILAD
jgi:hypothetical protein